MATDIIWEILAAAGCGSSRLGHNGLAQSLPMIDGFFGSRVAGGLTARVDTMQKTQTESAAQTLPVVIAGGGPVGLTLALTLAHYGVRCMVLERNPTTTTHPKMDITNGRSMELFRRIGAAEALKAVSASPDSPFDVAWITTLNGHVLHRFRYPSHAEFASLIRARNDGSQPREAPIRASQIMVEPALKALADRHDLIDVRFGVACEGFAAHEDGVLVHLRRAHDGGAEAVQCAYLAGCDGGGSIVRQSLGIGLAGQSALGARFITHFVSDARDILQRWGAAWHYQSNLGTLVAQNDWNTWTLLSRLPTDISASAINPSELLAQFAGGPVEHRILVSNQWSPNLLVANSYRAGRVFIAGDAAHQYIPTGGYGMNTGIGDAIDLGWKLAATLHGFGGPELLDSYERERRPVGLRNVEASGRHNATRVRIAALYSTDYLQAPGPQGDAARARIGSSIADIGNAENESYGIELGYSYAGSSLIAGDAGATAPNDPLHYEPSIHPGARLPSMFLEDGSAVYDLLGPWFSLLHFAGDLAPAFAAEAAALGIPLKLVDLTRSLGARQLYGDSAILVRPDTHIAWRASQNRNAATNILRRACGFAV